MHIFMFKHFLNIFYRFVIEYFRVLLVPISIIFKIFKNQQIRSLIMTKILYIIYIYVY